MNLTDIKTKITDLIFMYHELGYYKGLFECERDLHKQSILKDKIRQLEIKKLKLESEIYG